MLFCNNETQAADQLRRLERLTDRVYVALQPHDQRFDDCNVSVVLRSDHVLIVDAPTDHEFIQQLVTDLKILTDLPVRYLVNTHWHGDHTQGNATFRNLLGDQLTIIGHRSLIEDVPTRAAQDFNDRIARLEAQIPLAKQQLEKGLSLSGRALSLQEQADQQDAIANTETWLANNRDVVFLGPTLGYEQQLVLGDDTVPVHLIHVAAHTRGDTLVVVPGENLLIAGDVIDEVPFAGHGFPRAWLQALNKIQNEIKPTTIVPGHGAPVELKEIAPLIHYFESLVNQVSSGIAGGASLDELRSAVNVDESRKRLVGDDPRAQRFFDAVLPEAIERAYQEITEG